jgi:16S rRNA A1518/A1519 N6-dimethyltransferase RsmA/KsgA/DIM1 with predicted DNA glycosylase/AP lyase activity
MIRAQYKDATRRISVLCQYYVLVRLAMYVGPTVSVIRPAPQVHTPVDYVLVTA